MNFATLLNFKAVECRKCRNKIIFSAISCHVSGLDYLLRKELQSTCIEHFVSCWFYTFVMDVVI